MAGGRRARIAWTPAMIERLLQRREEGRTILQIAEELGMSHGLVGKQLARLGRVKPRMAKAERLAAFAELLAEGHGVCQAARMMGFGAGYGTKLFRALCAEVGEQAR